MCITRGNIYKRDTDSTTRAQLIRRGNEFFNSGKYNAAEKIFVTTDYKDGLVRLGDYYFEKGDMYRAARFYFLAENQSKIDTFCEKAANVISRWLSEPESDESVADNDDVNMILKIN